MPNSALVCVFCMTLAVLPLSVTELMSKKGAQAAERLGNIYFIWNYSVPSEQCPSCHQNVKAFKRLNFNMFVVSNLYFWLKRDF